MTSLISKQRDPSFSEYIILYKINYARSGMDNITIWNIVKHIFISIADYLMSFNKGYRDLQATMAFDQMKTLANKKDPQNSYLNKMTNLFVNTAKATSSVVTNSIASGVKMGFNVLSNSKISDSKKIKYGVLLPGAANFFVDGCITSYKKLKKGDVAGSVKTAAVSSVVTASAIVCTAINWMLPSSNG